MYLLPSQPYLRLVEISKLKACKYSLHRRAIIPVGSCPGHIQLVCLEKSSDNATGVIWSIVEEEQYVLLNIYMLCFELVDQPQDKYTNYIGVHGYEGRSRIYSTFCIDRSDDR